jgi:hypothetical protein
MAIIITAPNEDYSINTLVNNVKLFLAGGITNTKNWQKEIIDAIKDLPNLTIYNPRRENFPINDPKASEAQICWEYKHLIEADVIIFWFAKGSLNPIVLYELGRYGLSSNKPIIIGVDPEYERKQDVIIQTKLSRPELMISTSMDKFITKIKHSIYDNKGKS